MNKPLSSVLLGTRGVPSIYPASPSLDAPRSDIRVSPIQAIGFCEPSPLGEVRSDSVPLAIK